LSKTEDKLRSELKINKSLFCTSLDLHYLLSKTEDKLRSELKINKSLFCTSLDLHYL